MIWLIDINSKYIQNINVSSFTKGLGLPTREPDKFKGLIMNQRLQQGYIHGQNKEINRNLMTTASALYR